MSTTSSSGGSTQRSGDTLHLPLLSLHHARYQSVMAGARRQSTGSRNRHKSSARGLSMFTKQENASAKALLAACMTSAAEAEHEDSSFRLFLDAAFAKPSKGAHSPSSPEPTAAEHNKHTQSLPTLPGRATSNQAPHSPIRHRDLNTQSVTSLDSTATYARNRSSPQATFGRYHAAILEDGAERRKLVQDVREMLKERQQAQTLHKPTFLSKQDLEQHRKQKLAKEKKRLQAARELAKQREEEMIRQRREHAGDRRRERVKEKRILTMRARKWLTILCLQKLVVWADSRVQRHWQDTYERERLDFASRRIQFWYRLKRKKAIKQTLDAMNSSVLRKFMHRVQAYVRGKAVYRIRDFLSEAKDMGRFQWTMRRFYMSIVRVQRVVLRYMAVVRAQRTVVAMKWDKVDRPRLERLATNRYKLEVERVKKENERRAQDNEKREAVGRPLLPMLRPPRFDAMVDMMPAVPPDIKNAIISRDIRRRRALYAEHYIKRLNEFKQELDRYEKSKRAINAASLLTQTPWLFKRQASSRRNMLERKASSRRARASSKTSSPTVSTNDGNMSPHSAGLATPASHASGGTEEGSSHSKSNDSPTPPAISSHQPIVGSATLKHQVIEEETITGEVDGDIGDGGDTHSAPVVETHFSDVADVEDGDYSSSDDDDVDAYIMDVAADRGPPQFHPKPFSFIPTEFDMKILIQMGIEESRHAELGWLSNIDKIDDVIRKQEDDEVPNRSSNRRGSAFYPSTFAFNN